MNIFANDYQHLLTQDIIDVRDILESIKHDGFLIMELSAYTTSKHDEIEGVDEKLITKIKEFLADVNFEISDEVSDDLKLYIEDLQDEELKWGRKETLRSIIEDVSAVITWLEDEVYCEKGFIEINKRAKNDPTLIKETYFEEYAQDFAEECYVDKSFKDSPLYNCIDWGKWADMIQYNYRGIYNNPFTGCKYYTN